MKPYSGSQAAHRKRLLRNAYCQSTADIRASKASITSSIGICDEDRSRIRTGFGPENITRQRRFAVGILKSFQKPYQSMGARVESTFAEMMRKVSFNTRLVFDYLRMT